MIDVDGYTAADPILDEDWNDEVRWQVNTNLSERRYHNRDGFFCELAGSPECLALGHEPDPEDGWDDDPDGHPNGWNSDTLCVATRFGVACSECENDVNECEYQRPDTRAFWNLFTERKKATA